MDGQPRSDVSNRMTAADNSGDPTGNDELIDNVADPTVDRCGIGIERLEIDDNPAGAQTLKPLPFWV